MTRQTSIETYHKIKDEGLLSLRRWQVYDVIFHRGPITSGEIWKFHLSHNIQMNSVSPRTAELEKLGVIKAIGERVCKSTGQTCIVWEVTNGLPVKFEKPKRHKCITCNGTGFMKTLEN